MTVNQVINNAKAMADAAAQEGAEGPKRIHAPYDNRPDSDPSKPSNAAPPRPQTEAQKAAAVASQKGKETTKPNSGSILSVADVIRILVTIAIASCAASYYVTENSVTWGYRPWWTQPSAVMSWVKGPMILTPSQLSLYNGTDPSLPLLLSVNHTIFDVSSNPRTYGPGGSYSHFVGRDATRAFVSGCFQEDLDDDISGLEWLFVPRDDPDTTDEKELAMTMREKSARLRFEMRDGRRTVKEKVNHWVEFYRKSDKYFEVGKLVEEPGVVREIDERRPLGPCGEKQRPKRKPKKETKKEE